MDGYRILWATKSEGHKMSVTAWPMDGRYYVEFIHKSRSIQKSHIRMVEAKNAKIAAFVTAIKVLQHIKRRAMQLGHRNMPRTFRCFRRRIWVVMYDEYKASLSGGPTLSQIYGRDLAKFFGKRLRQRNKKLLNPYVPVATPKPARVAPVPKPKKIIEKPTWMEWQ